MKAKNREQYVNEWTRHLGQMIHVALDSDTPIADYDAFKLMGVAMIEKAADQLFPVAPAGPAMDPWAGDENEDVRDFERPGA